LRVGGGQDVQVVWILPVRQLTSPRGMFDSSLAISQLVCGARLQEPGEIVVGFGVLRVEPDGLVVIRDSLVELPLLVVGDSPVVEGEGVLGVEADGLRVIGDGLVVLPLVGVGNSPVAVGVGGLGVEADGLAVVADGLVVLLLVGVGESPVLVGASILGVLPDAGGEAGDGQVVVLLVESFLATLEVACNSHRRQEQDEGTGKTAPGHGRSSFFMESSLNSPGA